MNYGTSLQLWAFMNSARYHFITQVNVLHRKTFRLLYIAIRWTIKLNLIYAFSFEFQMQNTQETDFIRRPVRLTIARGHFACLIFMKAEGKVHQMRRKIVYRSRRKFKKSLLRKIVSPLMTLSKWSINKINYEFFENINFPQTKTRW